VRQRAGGDVDEDDGVAAEEARALVPELRFQKRQAPLSECFYQPDVRYNELNVAAVILFF
jgi:hypothetical protein